MNTTIPAKQSVYLRSKELREKGYQDLGYENGMTKEQLAKISEMEIEESLSSDYCTHLYISHKHKCFWKVDSGD